MGRELEAIRPSRPEDEDLPALLERLEARLAARMEQHQASLLEAVSGVERRVKDDEDDEDDEELLEERAAGDKAGPSVSRSGSSAEPPPTTQRGVGDDGNEPVRSSEELPAAVVPEARRPGALLEAMPAAACGGGAGVQEAEQPLSPTLLSPKAPPKAQSGIESHPVCIIRSDKSRPTGGEAMMRIASISRQLSRDNFKIKHPGNSIKQLDGVGCSKAWATKLANSWIFEIMVALTIVSNAVSIGWSSDWSIKNPGSPPPVVFVALDWAFLGFFVFELALRMYVEGRNFFSCTGKSFGWNVFDTMVVTLTLLNDAHVLPVHLSVVRVFRVVRLVYVVRVLRLMSAFAELKQMIDGIMRCGKIVLWSSLVLTALTYVYAVVCLQLSSDWLSSSAEESKEPSQTVLFLQKNFPSLIHSIYTLFKAVSGGVSWGEVSDPLQDVSPLLIATFPFFIIVTVFCVLNIVTAAFVDAAARKSQEDETAALRHIAARTQWIKGIEDIFARGDTDSTGFIDWDEFEAIMTDWRTRTALEELGVDMSFHHAATLFSCFDWDGDGRIDINEFAQGVHHLTGTARSLDMFRQFRRLSRQVSRLAQKLKPDASPMSSSAKEVVGVDA